MYSRRDFSKLGIALAGGLATFKGLSGTMTPGMAEETTQRFEVMKTDEEWRKTLTPEQFQVLRKHGTERAGSSPLDARMRPAHIAARAAACRSFVGNKIPQRHRLAELLAAARTMPSARRRTTAIS